MRPDRPEHALAAIVAHQPVCGRGGTPLRSNLIGRRDRVAQSGRRALGRGALVCAGGSRRRQGRGRGRRGGCGGRCVMDRDDRVVPRSKPGRNAPDPGQDAGSGVDLRGGAREDVGGCGGGGGHPVGRTPRRFAGLARMLWRRPGAHRATLHDRGAHVKQTPAVLRGRVVLRWPRPPPAAAKGHPVPGTADSGVEAGRRRDRCYSLATEGAQCGSE